MTANFEFIKQQFLETAKKPNTKATYNDQLNVFGQSLFTIAPNAYENVNELTHLELQQILDELAKTRRQNSIKNIYQTFKNCMRFAYRKDLVETDFSNVFNKVQAQSEHKSKKQNLPSKREIERLQEQLKMDCTSATKLKYRTVIEICLCALRVSETLALKWKNIDWQKNTILMEGEFTKNGETYRQPMNETVMQLLARLKPFANSEFVFTTRNGNLITRNSISTFLRQECKAAGIEPIGCHMLRKWKATNLFTEKGVPLNLVSKGILHHKQISTTEKYILHNEDETLEALKGLM